jgi:hypothetical protein
MKTNFEIVLWYYYKNDYNNNNDYKYNVNEFEYNTFGR